MWGNHFIEKENYRKMCKLVRRREKREKREKGEKGGGKSLREKMREQRRVGLTCQVNATSTINDHFNTT